MSDKPEKPDAAPPAAPAPARAATVDPKSAKVTAAWKGTSPLLSCRVDPTGTFVFTSGEDFTIHRFAIADGKRTDLKAHDSWLRGIAFSPDGKTLFTAGYDSRLIWWNAMDENPSPMQTVDAGHQWIRGIDVSPDGNTIATCGDDKTVKLWNAKDGSHLRTIEGHAMHVYSVLFHPDGAHLLSGCLDGKVHFVALESGKTVAEIDAGELYSYDKGFRKHFGGVRNMMLNEDATQLACGGLYQNTNAFAGVHKPRSIVFDLASGKALHSHLGAANGIVWDVHWHVDGWVLGACSGNGGAFLHFWNADEQPFHSLKLPNMLRGMDFHPDGKRIATAHHDRHVRITTLHPVGSA